MGQGEAQMMLAGGHFYRLKDHRRTARLADLVQDDLSIHFQR